MQRKIQTLGLNCLASEWISMIAQNRLSLGTRFFFATLPLLKTAKSLVISSATKMKNPQDPIRKLNAGNKIENVAQPPAICDSSATVNPSGVFQSNGNLNCLKKGKKNSIICSVSTDRMRFLLTQREKSNKTNRRPSQESNNWQLSTIK